MTTLYGQINAATDATVLSVCREKLSLLHQRVAFWQEQWYADYRIACRSGVAIERGSAAESAESQPRGVDVSGGGTGTFRHGSGGGVGTVPRGSGGGEGTQEAPA